jgi:putative peptidoglycan lipid II flippase
MTDETPLISEESKAAAHARRLAWLAAAVAAATATSRVIGLVREMLTGYYYGVGTDFDAYTNIAIFPNLIRALLADAAISAAFVPVFTQLLIKGDKERAFRLASTLLTLIAVAIGAVVVVFLLVAGPVINLVYGDYIAKYGQEHLMVLMTDAIMPTVVLLCTAGVLIGVLYAYERFVMPAVISIVWNVVIIVFLIAFAQRIGIWALVWGNVVGTVAELTLLLIPLRRLEYRYRFRFDIKDPAVKQTLLLMIPVTTALGILNFNALIDQYFASLVGEGGPSAIYYSFRLYQLPQGVFAIAIGTVLFTSMSRYAALNDTQNYRETLARGIRQVFFITLPFAVWFFAVPSAFVRLVYEHGVFGADATARVVPALAFFSVGMAFANGNIILNRGFQSLQRPWLPMWVALFNLALNAILDWLFYQPFGVWGITLATSIVATWNFLALMYLMRRQIKRMEGRAIVVAIAKMIVAAAVLGGLSYGLWVALRGLYDYGLLVQFLVVIVIVAVSGAAYLGIAKVLGIPEMDLLREMVRRRRRRGRGGTAPRDPDAPGGSRSWKMSEATAEESEAVAMGDVAAAELESGEVGPPGDLGR